MTFRHPRDAASPAARRALAALRERPVNFSLADAPGDPAQGWRIDRYCQPLATEPPGLPTPGGVWERAREVIRDYAFADPRLVRAVYEPHLPLESRDMLLVGRFAVLRFHLGVRVGQVVDEQRVVDGRPVRIWGWDYQTLEGHLEAGRMDYEVWKWLDTGAVEFRMRRFLRTAPIRNPIVRLGWAVFGRWMQLRFVDQACERMIALAATPPARSFPFRFEPLYRLVAAPLGVRPATARVQIVAGRLRVRFGPWHLETPVANIAGWEVAGPYAVPKTIGPARLSLADRGVTFATNRHRGLCIRFRKPVGSIDPLHRLRHPGLTVTVADVGGLAAALADAGAGHG